MIDNYQILIKKLDSFIRKYYKNQIIRGIIYSLSVLLIFFIIVTLIEYFAHFGILERTVIFYFYLFINILILIKLILIPLSKLYRIGNIISHKQAAEIIGKYFSDVRDRLLNTLQLKELSKNNKESAELIEASINQKIARLRPVPFTNAIDLSKNKKYLKFALPPLFLIILFLLASPRLITEPTNRIINYREHFEVPMPFGFVLLNNSLDAVQQEDFTVEVKLTGEIIPNKVIISGNNNSFRMRKESTTTFSYTFRNIQKGFPFCFEADGYKSQQYNINVLPKPIVLNFETLIDYPDYTGKQDETLENTGDLIVPEGTIISWNFYTRDTDVITLIFSDSVFYLDNNNSNIFSFKDQFFKSQSYSVSTKNNHITNKDSLVFGISVIPDSYPKISIEEFQDSIYDNRLYFRGFIKDDHGFRNLKFFYKKSGASDTSSFAGRFFSETLRIQPNTNQQQFFHYFDLASLVLQAGDEVEYYFEVWDNDGINGSKSSRSQKMIYKAPTIEEIEEKTEEANEQIKDEMEGALKELKLLQRDIDDLNKKLFDKKSLNWQEKQQVQNLLNRQKSLQERIEDIQDKNAEKNKQEEQFKDIDEDIIKKQEELQKLMDELMTDEMKKMLDEIQKLLDELDKDKINEMMKEMKLNNEDLEKQLDSSLELFKQLEFEKKLQETIDKLKELADKQDELAKETEESDKKDSEEKKLKEKQDNLNDEFQDIRKDIDDLKKKNEELEDPNKMEDTQSDEEQIEDLMEESSDNLEKNKNSKASQSQKGASQKMQELSQKMQSMLEGMQMEQLGEDINALREILENLIQVSFNQEDLMVSLDETSSNNPKYIKIIENQKNLKDDMQMIADSLHALSKRQTMIEPYVQKEISKINRNIEKSLKLMDDRKKGKALESQQYVMTSVNNLALLLSEALEQMQQQMMQMSGQCSKSSCSKPGSCSCSSKLNSMKKLQEQLNQQLQDLRNGKKPGKQGNNENQGMNEKLARLAAQQAAIRRKMEEYRDQLKEDGRPNDGNTGKMIDDMEKTEKDLVNKRITQEMMKRQQDILTRLLKSEKAERKREEEQKRESREAKDYKPSNPDQFFEYHKLKNNEVELLKTVPPNFHPFYKNKVNEYFYRFQNF